MLTLKFATLQNMTCLNLRLRFGRGYNFNENLEIKCIDMFSTNRKIIFLSLNVKTSHQSKKKNKKPALTQCNLFPIHSKTEKFKAII